MVGGVDALAGICGKIQSKKEMRKQIFYPPHPWGQIRIISYDPDLSAGKNLAGRYIGCFNVIPLYLGVSH